MAYSWHEGSIDIFIDKIIGLKLSDILIIGALSWVWNLLVYIAKLDICEIRFNLKVKVLICIYNHTPYRLILVFWCLEQVFCKNIFLCLSCHNHGGEARVWSTDILTLDLFWGIDLREICLDRFFSGQDETWDRTFLDLNPTFQEGCDNLFSSCGWTNHSLMNSGLNRFRLQPTEHNFKAQEYVISIYIYTYSYN